MANETSLRSYRDFDAYNRDGSADDTVRKASAGDPLAELARIMGQDDNYADLLKSVARTRGELPSRRTPEADAGQSLELPAMRLRGADQSREPDQAGVTDWDDLEAELESYVRSGEGARPKAEAGRRAEAPETYDHLFDDDGMDDEVAAHRAPAPAEPAAVQADGLRGSYPAAADPAVDDAAGSLRDLERMLSDSHGRQPAVYQPAVAPQPTYQVPADEAPAYQASTYPQQAYPRQIYQPPAYSEPLPQPVETRRAAQGQGGQAPAGQADDIDERIAQAFADDQPRDQRVAAAGYGAAVAGAGALVAATAWRQHGTRAAAPQMAAAERGDTVRYADDAYLPAAERAASDPVFIQDGHMPQPAPEVFDEAPPRRKRAGVTAILAVVGLAVAGGGGVLGYRALTGGASNSGEPRVVRANTDPVRVPVQQAQDPKPVTDRVPSGDRVVSREERPVSPREQAAQVQAPPQPAAPRVIPLAPSAPAGSVTDPGLPMVRSVQSVVVPSANAAPAAVLRPTTPEAPLATASAAPRAAGEEPRRVRTVTVGPDNQILNPAPRPTPAPAAMPLSVVPTAPSQPPSAAATPAAPTLASADSRSAPTPTPRPARAGRPPADANEAAAAPGARPLDIAPQRTASLRQPAAAPPAPAAGGGTSFVQISSHQTEAEARSAFASAQRRYSVLQGQSANIRSAELPGRGTWYRLRVGPFSRTDAQSFCERLKSSGGSCVIN
ncbi:SPOR domain-containing protein [Phreatobacter stygius]|uniref:SPOR domain-containing protein n=1 Tax=Phreatobacter stygius TaxID=1940610 RepID=A0A4D7BIB6_9HYPH|nr:SPOR domain-containing protein [Phreatobacter stygius]QCI68796.1 hypothetical protein E8M01_33920 [Phreatobacter stygius]